MLKVFVLVAALVSAGAVQAQEHGEESPAEWHYLQYACQSGETWEREKLSAADRKAECEARDNLGVILEMHGYCWSSADSTWIVSDGREASCDAKPAS